MEWKCVEEAVSAISDSKIKMYNCARILKW